MILICGSSADQPTANANTEGDLTIQDFIKIFWNFCRQAEFCLSQQLSWCLYASLDWTAEALGRRGGPGRGESRCRQPPKLSVCLLTTFFAFLLGMQESTWTLLLSLLSFVVKTQSKQNMASSFTPYWGKVFTERPDSCWHWEFTPGSFRLLSSILPAIVNNNPACSSQTKTGGVYCILKLYKEASQADRD